MKNRKLLQKNYRLQKRKKIIIFVGAGLLVSALILTSLEFTNRTYFFHDRKAVSGIIPSNSNAKKGTSISKEKDENTAASTPVSSPPESPKEGDTPQPIAPTGQAPVTPFGNFISNHHPNLSGKPAPSAVESVCNTTPGAQCLMTLTNSDGIVKSLEARTTDSSGAAFWSWDIKQAGLTVGSWKIKVTATLNGQSKTTEDTQSLEVGS